MVILQAEQQLLSRRDAERKDSSCPAVVNRRVHRQVIAEGPAVLQLHHLLFKIVGVVVAVVVGFWILLYIGEKHRQVGLIILGFASKSRHPEDIPFAKITAGEKERVGIGPRVILVSFRKGSGEPGIKTEIVLKSPGIHLGRHPARAERPARKLHADIGIISVQANRLEVDGTGVRCGAVGSGSDTPLHLHRFDTVHEIGKVGEKHALVDHIVQRDPVQRNINPGLVDTPHAKLDVISDLGPCI